MEDPSRCACCLTRPIQISRRECMSHAGPIVEALFRDKYREILGVLLREYGIGNIEIIEEAIQEAIAKAIEVWRPDDMPGNPGGWLYVATRRGVIDRLRRVRRERLLKNRPVEEDMEAPPVAAHPLDDDVLAMIFVCCHPALGWKAQLVLTLRYLCGLDNDEIASVLLSKPDATKKMLTRAKKKIIDLGLKFELPSQTVLDQRIDGVLRAIYMMFNAGYLSPGKGHFTYPALCEQSIKLATLLSREESLSDNGKASALAALLLLHGSRLSARTGKDGTILRLSEQDRALWDCKMIALGMGFLEQSMQSDEQSSYHLQAAIAACHAVAPSYEATDWATILRYYDQLLSISWSPVVALNRTVAVAQVDGYSKALTELAGLESNRALRGYYLVPALKADYLDKLGQVDAAATNYARALEMVEDPTLQRFFRDRHSECLSEF